MTATVVTDLAIPDPRHEPLPVGWWDTFARPAIEACESWDALDEAEARLRAFIGYIDALRGDAIQFECALRCIEARRGRLLAPRRPGERTDLRPPAPGVVGVEASPQTQGRWRKIAEHWPEVHARLREADDVAQVTQAAVLRLVDPSERPAGAEWCSVRVDDLEAAARTLRKRLGPEERRTLARLITEES